METTDILLMLIIILQVIRILQHSKGAEKIIERFWFFRQRLTKRR